MCKNNIIGLWKNKYIGYTKKIIYILGLKPKLRNIILKYYHTVKIFLEFSPCSCY